MKWKRLIVFSAIFSIISVSAQEHEEKDNTGHHHISAFGGFTTDHKSKDGYKLGLEYEYRLSQKVGLGGTLDFTGKDFETFSFSIGSSFYLFKFPLVPAVAIGGKFANEKWKPFFRTMLAYDFHLGDFSLGPMIMWDIYTEEKDIFTYGLTVGYSLH